jgi:class 3 adenylate cyclase
MPFLEWMQGGRVRGRIELRPGAEARLGRGADAQGRVDGDPYMSRLHVVVLLEGTGLRVRTLPSATNAVFHGGVEKTDFLLASGESFVVGATRFRFAAEAAAPGKTVPPPPPPPTASAAESTAQPAPLPPPPPPPPPPRVVDPFASWSPQLERFFSPRVVETLRGDKERKGLKTGIHECTVLHLGLGGFSEPAGFEGDGADALRTAMSAATEEIFKEEGTLVRYTGSGLVACWNAPLRDSDHAARACRAALAIAARLEASSSLNVGIGLQSGRVAAGPVGSDLVFAYGAVGSAVDEAARIQGATRALGARVLAARAAVESPRGADGPTATPLGFFRPAGAKADLELYELAPGPADARRLAAFEAYETAFSAGSWSAAADALKSRPKEDATALALTALARKYAANPPKNWRGVVELSE